MRLRYLALLSSVLLVPVAFAACSADEKAKPVDTSFDRDTAPRDTGSDTGTEEDTEIDSSIDTDPPDTGAADADASETVDSAAILCTNAMKDPGETDVDCGGMKCGPCAIGKACTNDNDCVEKKCNAMSKLCSAPVCTDGVRNGTETDTDCGSTCPPCGDFKRCAFNSDCASGVCTAGQCQAPSCTDTVKNGTESDVDCGGTCAKCLLGQRCNNPADCGSKSCVTAGGVLRCECPSGMTRINVPTASGTYCIDQTEVSNQQYSELFLKTGLADPTKQPDICKWNLFFTPTVDWPAPEARFGYPVRGVDWCDAYMYCQAQGKTLCGKIGGGAVPADKYNDYAVSKWHQACSQSGVNAYPYGSTYSASTCNGGGFAAATDAGASNTYAVVAKDTLTTFSSGSFLNKSCIGGPGSDTYQLSGNVAEWEDSCSGTAGAADPCLVRGGSHLSTPDDLKCAAKREVPRNTMAADVGFRCCF